MNIDALSKLLTPYSLATVSSVSLNMLLAFILGLVIAAIYKWTHMGMPAETFTNTLIILCMLISVVMVVIGESVARAFSLVGALSIIRFRTVVQDPRDIAFVFFALAIGMGVGAGNPSVSIIGTFLIGTVILGLHGWQTNNADKQGFLVTFRVPICDEFEQYYQSVFNDQLSTYRRLSRKATSSGTVELEYRVKLKHPEQWAQFIQELSITEDITKVKAAKF